MTTPLHRSDCTNNISGKQVVQYRTVGTSLTNRKESDRVRSCWPSDTKIVLLYSSTEKRFPISAMLVTQVRGDGGADQVPTRICRRRRLHGG